MPIHIRADAPQARSLLAGLQGVGHVLAEAVYNADSLRAFIADDPAATAQIRTNSGRTKKPPIDWQLYKERHRVERFRRIAARCEKTRPAFMRLVPLACAMIRLR